MKRYEIVLMSLIVLCTVGLVALPDPTVSAEVIKTTAPRKKDRPRILRTYTPNGICIPDSECSAQNLVIENPLKYDVDATFFCGSELMEPTVTLPADKTSTVLITSNTDRGLTCSLSTWKKAEPKPPPIPY